MKVCVMCGAQNDDVFTKCAICGADLPSPNGAVGDDEKTILIDPTEAEPKSGLSLNTDTSTYGQAGANSGQSGFNSQPGASMGQPGFNGQPGASMGQPGFNGQPGAPMGQPGYNGQPAAYGQPGLGAGQASPKNKGIIIGILAGAVALVAILVFVLFKLGVFSGKGGAKSPEDVAKQFVEAMNERDADKIAALCPPFLDPGIDDLEEGISAYDGYDVTFKYEGIESKNEYTGSDLDDYAEEVSDYADKKIKLQGACELEFTYSVEMNYLGETYSDSTTETVTCIKYKGSWYLYE